MAQAPQAPVRPPTNAELKTQAQEFANVISRTLNRSIELTIAWHAVKTDRHREAFSQLLTDTRAAIEELVQSFGADGFGLVSGFEFSPGSPRVSLRPPKLIIQSDFDRHDGTLDRMRLT